MSEDQKERFEKYLEKKNKVIDQTLELLEILMKEINERLKTENCLKGMSFMRLFYEFKDLVKTLDRILDDKPPKMTNKTEVEQSPTNLTVNHGKYKEIINDPDRREQLYQKAKALVDAIEGRTGTGEDTGTN